MMGTSKNYWHFKLKVVISCEGSKVFSIIADEARDCSNKEQMPLIIRYVNSHKHIVESFVCFIECERGTSGSQLATLIDTKCGSLGLI